MIDTESLEETVQELIVDLCKTLYDHGYREVPVGAIMRLIGATQEEALKHDQEYFRLDGEFEQLINEEEEFEKEMSNAVPPPGTVFH